MHDLPQAAIDTAAEAILDAWSRGQHDERSSARAALFAASPYFLAREEQLREALIEVRKLIGGPSVVALNADLANEAVDIIGAALAPVTQEETR